MVSPMKLLNNELVPMSQHDLAQMAVDAATREAAIIEWQDALTYRRDHPLVVMLGAALNLTEAQIDNIWRTASEL